VSSSLLQHWLDSPQEMRLTTEPGAFPAPPAQQPKKPAAPQAKPTPPAKVK